MTADQERATVTRVLEWSDTDASGHHHNSFLLRLVESAERELMTRAGVRDTYFWSAPRVRQEIDFRSKLYFGQQVSATAWIQRLGTSSLTLGFEVWGEADERTPRRLAAHGTVVVAHVPMGTEKSTPWPDEIRAVLRPDQTDHNGQTEHNQGER